MQEYFNQYCLTKEIASKPSGVLYLAHRINEASEKVALKVFNTVHFTSEQHCQTFLQMIEKTRELRHSSIVPILNVGVEQGQPYVVRQYLANSSLRHRLDSLSPKRLNLQEAFKITYQIGQALRHAHEHRILHGNLKPENIFFNDHDEILLTDFGLASFTNATDLNDHSELQTRNYLAPEQCVGTLTQKSDQYALGCLTYELLTGQAPFSAQSFSPVVSLASDEANLTNSTEETEVACENSQCPDYGKVGGDNVRKFGKTRKGVQRWQCKTCHTTWSFSCMETPLQTELLALTDLAPNLPEAIEEVVFKAMAKNPSERYATISIFLNALQIALLLPTFPFTSSPVPSLPIYIPKLVEKMPSKVPITTPVVGGHRKRILNDEDARKDLKMPDSDTYLSHKASLTSKLDAHLPNKTIVTSPGAHLPNKAGVRSNPGNYLPNNIGMISDSAAHLPNKDRVEALPQVRHPQFNKPLAPTLWLAFALSSIILLLGTLTLYTLIPSHLPASHLPASPKPVGHSVYIFTFTIGSAIKNQDGWCKQGSDDKTFNCSLDFNKPINYAQNGDGSSMKNGSQYPLYPGEFPYCWPSWFPNHSELHTADGNYQYYCGFFQKAVQDNPIVPPTSTATRKANQ